MISFTRMGAVAGASVLVLTLAACGADSGPDPDGSPSAQPTATPSASPSAAPSPSAEPTPVQLTEAELESALLTVEDLSALLAEGFETISMDDWVEGEDEGDEWLDGDEACLVIQDHSNYLQHNESEEGVGAAAFFRSDDYEVTSSLDAYVDVDTLQVVMEEFSRLLSECQTSRFIVLGMEGTASYTSVQGDDIDSRFTALGDDALIYHVAYSTDEHGVFGGYTAFFIVVEHVVVTLGLLSADEVSDDVVLPLIERAVEKADQLLASSQ